MTPHRRISATALLTLASAAWCLEAWATPAVHPGPPPSVEAHAVGANSSPIETPHAVKLTAWDPNAVPKPNFGDIVEQPSPQGMPLERARRAGALKLAAGTLGLLCPNWSSGCSSAPGAFASFTLLHRPEAWFAWGTSLDGFSASQGWQEAEFDVALTHHIGSARLLAELHPLSDAWIDPYFGIGLGAGFISTRTTVTSNDPGGPSTGSDDTTTWTPFYAARFGTDFSVDERVRVGLMFDWSNFLALTGENCPWKAFGACSSGGWASFPADNAVWKLGAELSFAFGQEL